MVSPVSIEQPERCALIVLELNKIADVFSDAAVERQTGARDIESVFGGIARLGHFAAAAGNELLAVAGHIAEIEHDAGME